MTFNQVVPGSNPGGLTKFILVFPSDERKQRSEGLLKHESSETLVSSTRETYTMTQTLRSQGLMLILSSPSGAGKSSLAKSLVQLDRNTKLSVSATTREMRPGEINGQDYHFLTKEKFNDLIAQDAFLEYATVFDNHYGTLTSEVEKYISLGRDVVFDVDWQGAGALGAKKPDNVVSIYILPPSLAELKTRLATRRQDDDATIAARMSQAKEEISHYPEYDYIVINDKFDEALLKVQSILSAERSKRVRLDLLDSVVRGL